MPRRINDEYDIGKAFRAIEEELMASMVRNMKRHRAWEDDEGFHWEQWQAMQLKSLERYKRQNKKRFQGQFKDINKEIESLIYASHIQGGMDQEIKILRAMQRGYRFPHMPQRMLDLLEEMDGKTFRQKAGLLLEKYRGHGLAKETGEFFKINDRKLDALINATTNDMQKAETAVLRMANDQYRKIIYNAQVYANTGAGTYEKAVDMATKDMLSAGLNCVEYANGARHTLSDYADMAIRTASKRAYLQGEGQKRQEWGLHLVIMNKRGNPCPKCLPFVGKVLIDDVWGGGSKADGDYPLMSAAISAGLYHPRCKDGHTTYFPGISTPPDDKFSKKELAEIEDKSRQEAKQQYAARQAKKYGRLARFSLDGDNQKKYSHKEKVWKFIVEISNSGMASLSDNIQWPLKGRKISNDEYKEVMSYARERNIELSGFKQYDGNIQTIKELIDDAESALMEYPEIKAGKKRLTVMLDETMDNMDFAITRGHIISINANAFRDTGLLTEEYSKLEKSGWFVKGTDYHAIIKHEVGHVVANRYGIDGLEVAMKLTGKGRKETMQYVAEHLSGYAGEFKDGTEIISEVFADVYGSGEPSEFSLRFIEECDKIKKKRT